jgi:hypothetical protein
MKRRFKLFLARREAADLERRTRLWRSCVSELSPTGTGSNSRDGYTGSRSPPLRCVVDYSSIRSNSTADPTDMGAPGKQREADKILMPTYGSIHTSFQSLPVSHGDRSGEVGCRASLSGCAIPTPGGPLCAFGTCSHGYRQCS